MRYSAFFSLLLLAGPAAVIASPIAGSIPGANDILSKTKDIVQSGGDAIQHAENLVPHARDLEHEEEKRQTTSSGSSGSSGFEALGDELGDAVEEYIDSKGGLAAAFNSSSSGSSGLSQIPGAKKLSKFMGGSSSDDSDSKKKNKNKNKDDDN